MPYLLADIGNAEGEPVVPERQIRITEKPGVPDGECGTGLWNKYLSVKVSGKNRKGRREVFSYLSSPKAGYNDSSSQAASLASRVPQQ